MTFTTDFGRDSPYVAAMKAKVLAVCPDARLVDVSHEGPPFDIRSAAFVLWAGSRDFHPPAVHVAVIDPGVGGVRRGVAVEVEGGARYVGPDNGVFELVLRERTAVAAAVLAVPAGAAPTFHGRDVFAPAAGRLAAGASVAELGPAADLERRPDPPAPVVLWIDRFGNVVTSLRELPASVAAGGRVVRARARTYEEGPEREPFLYVGSLGYVEIGVRLGRAGEALGVTAGAPLEVVALS